MQKYYYYHTKCSNTTIITQCVRILLLSLHSATNPLRSTWARAAAHVVGNYMSGYGTLGSGILHSTCTSDEIQSPTCINDSWSLSHLGYLYPGTTPVMIKLDHLVDHIIIPINVRESHWFPAHKDVKFRRMSFLDSSYAYSAADYPRQKMLLWKFYRMAERLDRRQHICNSR